MSPSDTLSPQLRAPLPSRKKRLAWWFGIYLVGNVACLLYLYPWNNPITFSAQDFPGLLLFPIALVGLVDFLPKFMEHIPFSLLACACYGLYLLHVIFTLRAPNRATFHARLLLLVLIIGTNIWAWKYLADTFLD